MLAQSWIVNRYDALSVSIHQGSDLNNDCAILFAGFTNSSSDIDYFMSRLARLLGRSGLTVYLIDPRGHGDSSGNIDDVTLESIREDIYNSFQYVTKRNNGYVFCIGHGLAGVLAADVLGGRSNLGFICIYPYLIHPSQFKIDLFCDEGKIDASRLESNFKANLLDDEVEDLSLMGAMGADRGNMLGRELSIKLIEQLTTYNPFESLENFKENILIINNEKDFVREVRFWKGRVRYLPRSPYAQEKIMRLVVDKINKWVK
ncbi:hypothetical protein GCM10008014_39100 [Paenibacillus silvae]|uniref:Serine aminopeptidase S33 domain-containing protein n=1 Tax=Paenibacillus silvae TaxID=1325358 RepID=A0ABQ1ZHT0_9BACL|nr:alpha/beta fold hydrolase [Paenibacillus silvae]GGH62549.1 hypothetical protein GCM10008014_39100 [Paenibacillus silvae]